MKQLGRALVLCFLSAITAEFLLGDQWLNGQGALPGQVAELILYMAYYGSAALLIREVVRRTGRGWPSILLLGLAFGILEEGLIDQTLFNPTFAGEHLLANGFIPALGMGGPWTIFVLSLHVIWSIGAPIAIAEALFPRPLARRTSLPPQVQAPWLRTPGIVIAIILYLVGAAAIFSVTVLAAHFMATPGQLIGSLVAAALVILLALRLPRRAPRLKHNAALALAVGVVITTAYTLGERYLDSNPWTQAAIEALLLAIGFVVAGLVPLDVFGLAVGVVVTYFWLGIVKAVPISSAALIEQIVLVAVVAAVIAVAFVRRRRVSVESEPEPLERVAAIRKVE